MEENYDDDQHLHPNPSEWAKWCDGINRSCTHLGFDPWECQCGEGWIPLLDILFQYADEWNRSISEDETPNGDEQIRIDCVKEKFGGLRFYYTGGSPEFRGMVEMAEMLSSVICETCGDQIGRAHV